MIDHAGERSGCPDERFAMREQRSDKRTCGCVSRIRTRYTIAGAYPATFGNGSSLFPFPRHSSVVTSSLAMNAFHDLMTRAAA